MGLEDIIKAILAPIEGIAQKAYDAVFADKGADGTLTYRDDYIAQGAGIVRDFYKGIRDILIQYILRPIDKTAGFIYDKTVEYVYTPLATAAQNFVLDPLKKVNETYPVGTPIALGLGLLYFI